MSTSIIDVCYPERRFGGFTRCDGTIAFYDRVNALVGPHTTVLDAGCGRGRRVDDPCEYRRGLQNLRGRCRRVIGIDVDAAAAANPFVDEFRLAAPGARWPLDDASCDLAVSDYVLEHVSEPDTFFAEARRVLKPGGYFCARTPNAWGYVAMLSRLIPNRWHARVLNVAQEGRRSEDVFPTVYRCNTRGTVGRILRRHGFDYWIGRHEAEPAYLHFSPLAYRLGVLAQRLLPPALRSTLWIFAQRRE